MKKFITHKMEVSISHTIGSKVPQPDKYDPKRDGIIFVRLER